MRQVLLSFLFLLGCGSFCKAQNLVPNPSFEDTLECPDFPGQVWRAQGWYIAENTPDYFHSCCNNTFPVCGVPNNAFTIRDASTGVAYCGMQTYAAYPPPEYKEEIGVELLSPMEIGTRYYVSMKVSSVSSYNQAINGANNKIGILFSTIRYDVNNPPPNNNYSQFYTDSIITDTSAWTLIHGSFIADSAYMFLTIGNFYDNLHTDTIRYWYISGNNQLVAYYFIDDVCVTTDSEGCDFSTSIYTPSKDIPFVVYPNPAVNQLNVTLKSVEVGFIQLFNVYGQSVFRKEFAGLNETVEINTSGLPAGTYFLQVNTGRSSYSKKISISKN